MTEQAQHPTIKQFHARQTTGNGIARPQTLDREWLRQVCLEAGADDAGFVEIDRPEIADQKTDIFWLLPKAKTLISFVVRMNRENIRTPPVPSRISNSITRPMRPTKSRARSSRCWK